MNLHTIHTCLHSDRQTDSNYIFITREQAGLAINIVTHTCLLDIFTLYSLISLHDLTGFSSKNVLKS